MIKKLSEPRLLKKVERHCWNVLIKIFKNGTEITLTSNLLGYGWKSHGWSVLRISFSRGKINGIFTSLQLLHVWLCLTDFTDYYIFLKVSVKAKHILIHFSSQRFCWSTFYWALMVWKYIITTLWHVLNASGLSHSSYCH